MLYDAIISLFIISMVIITMFYVINQEEDYSQDDTEVLNRLNLISSVIEERNNAIENENITYDVINEILSDKNYTLNDLTINRTIITNYHSEYKNSVSAKKIIGEHEFELIFYN